MECEECDVEIAGAQPLPQGIVRLYERALVARLSQSALHLPPAHAAHLGLAAAPAADDGYR
jgi:hypothetical protein